MNSAKSTVPFKGTPEQEAQLIAVIEEKKDTQGALMPILQKAQEIYGYLPIEVQTIISDKTGIPLEKIYGVVTFYAQFSLFPKGEYQISVCLGTACYVKGSGDIYEKLLDSNIDLHLNLCRAFHFFEDRIRKSQYLIQLRNVSLHI